MAQRDGLFATLSGRSAASNGLPESRRSTSEHSQPSRGNGLPFIAGDIPAVVDHTLMLANY